MKPEPEYTMGDVFIRILFYFGIVFLLLGTLTFYQPDSYAMIFFLLGYACLSLFYLIKIIWDWIKKETQTLNITLHILCILMSVTLLFKYYQVPFDILSFFVVPLFIISAAIYLIKGKKKYTELTLTVLIYLYLSLPLFGIVYRKKEKLRPPRQYIPVEWYKQSDILPGLPIELAYEFETNKAKRLFKEANKLARAKKYEDAIEILSEIIVLEPWNTEVYIELANSYGFSGKYDAAITVLDQAIATNDSLSYLFHNRGIMYAKLNQNANAIADYQKAIALDSGLYLAYINIALSYCYQNKFQEAWEAIQKAEELGGKEMLDNMPIDLRKIAQRWR